MNLLLFTFICKLIILIFLKISLIIRIFLNVEKDFLNVFVFFQDSFFDFFNLEDLCLSHPNYLLIYTSISIIVKLY